MGAGRLVTILLWVSTLSRPTVMVDYWVGILSTTLRPALQCWAWSSSLDRNLDPMTRVEWVGLVCARGTDETCVFRGTQLGYIDSRIAIST
jgi:hypothetical protein